MKALLFIGLLFISASCQENSKILKSGDITALKPLDLKDFKVDIQDWKVGPRKKQEVSKGIKVDVFLPLMEREELRRIIKKYGVDSWVVHVKKRGRLKTDIIGRFFIPFYVNKADSADLHINQKRKFTFKAFYTAAKHEVRFSHFSCPAFGHNLTIDDTFLKPDNQERKQLVLRPGKWRRYPKKIGPFHYKLVFDAGMSMKGDYFVELAFYNKQRKRVLSNFINLGQKVVIKKEVPETLRKCRQGDGVGKMPKKQRKNLIKDFNR